MTSTYFTSLSCLSPPTPHSPWPHEQTKLPSGRCVENVHFDHLQHRRGTKNTRVCGKMTGDAGCCFLPKISGDAKTTYFLAYVFPFFKKANKQRVSSFFFKPPNPKYKFWQNFLHCFSVKTHVAITISNISSTSLKDWNLNSLTSWFRKKTCREKPWFLRPYWYINSIFNIQWYSIVISYIKRNIIDATWCNMTPSTGSIRFVDLSSGFTTPQLTTPPLEEAPGPKPTRRPNAGGFGLRLHVAHEK